MGVPFNTVLARLENEDNDVVYDKEKDEAALRVALSERLSGRTEDASSKDKLTQMKEKVKTSTEINTEDVGTTLRTAKGSPIKRSIKYGVGKEIGGRVYFHKRLTRSHKWA